MGTGIALLAAAWLSGCTYRMDAVPSPDEFALPHADLVARYPQLDPIFPEYAAEHPFGMARAREFVAAWGEPYERRLSWWNLWPGNWLFVPQSLWRWNLAGKIVECRIDHPIYDGFEATVCDCRYLGGGPEAGLRHGRIPGYARAWPRTAKEAPRP